MSTVTLLTLCLLTQRADAGVARVPDAGVAVEKPRPAPAPDVKRLERELGELRQKLADVEARVAKVEGSVSKVDELAKKLAAVEGKLEAAEEKRLEVEQRAARRKVQLEQVATSLTGALQVLSTGGTNVDAALRYAEATYTGVALEYLRTARQALASGDLNTARQAIALAIVEAQLER